MAQSIKYMHAAAGFPVKETWLDAIDAGNYVTWPGLTTAAARKHFPDSDETQKGHMKKQRQGVRSTRTKEKPAMHDETTNNDNSPPRKMRDIYVKIHNAGETMHSDQTGRFPATSSRGNQYIMVLVEVDGNYIDAEPVLDSNQRSLINAYQTLWKRLTIKRDEMPTMHIIDNEASQDFKAEIRKN